MDGWLTGWIGVLNGHLDKSAFLGHAFMTEHTSSSLQSWFYVLNMFKNIRDLQQGTDYESLWRQYIGGRSWLSIPLSWIIKNFLLIMYLYCTTQG